MLGYAVTAITGDVGGVVIDGEVGTGGANQTNVNGLSFDNTIFASDSSGDGGSVDGIDFDGLEFTADGTEYNVYNADGFIDPNFYPKGITVADREMAAINMTRDNFHGEWNYQIRPCSPTSLSLVS